MTYSYRDPVVMRFSKLIPMVKQYSATKEELLKLYRGDVPEDIQQLFYEAYIEERSQAIASLSS